VSDLSNSGAVSVHVMRVEMLLSAAITRAVCPRYSLVDRPYFARIRNDAIYRVWQNKSTESDTQMHRIRLWERTVWKPATPAKFHYKFRSSEAAVTLQPVNVRLNLTLLFIFRIISEIHLNGSRSGTEVVGNSVCSIKQAEPYHCRILGYVWIQFC
jgi:hypothetical protein